jgi:hypothetical protein
MRQSKKEKEDEQDLRRNPVNVFQCGHKDCAKLEAIPAKDFQKHLTDVHGITKDQQKGTKRMTMHMDGSYWYSYDYTWTLDCGLEFQQYIKAARAKDDPMRH